jgi:N utilization substance protein A
VAYVELEELAGIEGFDDELAEELQQRAKEALDKREEAYRATRRELGVEDALAGMPHLNEQMLVVLGKAGIKTLDDLADLATDEVDRQEARGSAPPQRRNRTAVAPQPAHRGQGRSARRVRAQRRAGQRDHHGRPRAHWFEDEEAPVTEGAPAPVTEEAAGAGILAMSR